MARGRSGSSAGGRGAAVPFERAGADPHCGSSLQRRSHRTPAPFGRPSRARLVLSCQQAGERRRTARTFGVVARGGTKIVLGENRGRDPRRVMSDASSTAGATSLASRSGRVAGRGGAAARPRSTGPARPRARPPRRPRGPAAVAARPRDEPLRARGRRRAIPPAATSRPSRCAAAAARAQRAAPAAAAAPGARAAARARSRRGRRCSSRGSRGSRTRGSAPHRGRRCSSRGSRGSRTRGPRARAERRDPSSSARGLAERVARRRREREVVLRARRRRARGRRARVGGGGDEWERILGGSLRIQRERRAQARPGSAEGGS